MRLRTAVQYDCQDDHNSVLNKLLMPIENLARSSLRDSKCLGEAKAPKQSVGLARVGECRKAYRLVCRKVVDAFQRSPVCGRLGSSGLLSIGKTITGTRSVPDGLPDKTKWVLGKHSLPSAVLLEYFLHGNGRWVGFI
jgi:hypothetical protein